MCAFQSASRRIRTFPPFPDLAADPDGIMAYWLENIRVDVTYAYAFDHGPWFQEGPRVNADSLWMWIKKGRGECGLPDLHKTYPIQAGDLLLIPPQTRYINRFPVDKHIVCIRAHFCANIFGQVDAIGLLGFPLHIPGQSRGRLAEISEHIARENILTAPGWRNMMAAEILSGLLHIVRFHGSRFGAVMSRERCRHMFRLKPVFNRIQSSLDNPRLSGTSLAKSMGLSDVQFRHVFRQATGISLLPFIQKQRIQRACELLRSTPQAIKEIACQTGFSDLPFFYRIFRRWMGQTPQHYRQLADPRSDANRDLPSRIPIPPWKNPFA